jgi:hypothetical protein
MEVAVGINSYALMQLSEQYKETFGFTPVSECECVKHDIDQLGFQDWVENYLNDVSATVGIYVYSGTAVFDEDSADYRTVCTRVRPQYNP